MRDPTRKFYDKILTELQENTERAWRMNSDRPILKEYINRLLNHTNKENKK